MHKFRKTLRIIKNTFTGKPINDYHIHPTAIIYKRKNLIIDKTALLCEYVIIRSPISKLIIGKNTQIGPFTVIFTHKEDLIIGNNVMIAPHCVIAAGNHDHKNTDIPMRFSGSISDGPIIIEDDVWIGANCTITDNVKIGTGAVIGANTLVNKDVKPYEIVGGVPMRHITSRKNEHI
jgi:acetyltransferase-like isoleucine patch superfamily enzyme